MKYSILYKLTTVSEEDVVFHAIVNGKDEKEARNLFEMATPNGVIVEIEAKG